MIVEYCKRIFATGVLLVLGLSITCCTEKKPFTPGYVPSMSPGRAYDLAKEVSFTGQIIDIISDTTPPPIAVDEGQIMGDDERALISVVVTSYQGRENHTYLVQLGPKWYLDLKGLTLFRKKDIIVTASPVETPDLLDKQGTTDLKNEEGIMLAREVQVGDYKLTLRDKNGVPAWYQQGRIKGILNNWQEQIKQDEMKKYIEQQKQMKGGPPAQ